MKKAVEILSDKLRFIRNEVNFGLVDSLRVECYGSYSTIKEIGFSNKINGQIQILLSDPSLCGKVVEAIKASGFNAYSSGKNTVIVSCPKIYDEERAKIEKQVKLLSEEAKVSIRNIRAKQRKLDKEDKEIQPNTDFYINRVDSLVRDKLESL